nr:DUF6371 domain-containing protein [Winogradskyella wandonensis]
MCYKDNETDNYLNVSIGRCDRESKCGFHSKPNGNKTIVNIHSINSVAEPTCHNDDVIAYYSNNYCNNNFVKYLLQYFSSQQIAAAIKKYFVATSNHWNGATIFWQVDHNMNIMAGKVMLYDSQTGKRVKKPYPHINWMHKVIPVNNFVLQQCLFGIHNLYDYEYGSTICIVESEKTAIILSILFPQYLWLATGSKSNFKEALLRPLRKYKVIVYPDNLEFSCWEKKSIEFRNKGYNILCSALLESEDVSRGDDLIDLIGF